MPDSSVPITAGTGTPIDTRTNASGDHRQVLVVGGPLADAAVAEVLNAAPAAADWALAVRPIPPAITKGTQGTTGYTVQDLHNAGRVPLHFFSNVAVAGASAEALLSLTGMKNFAAVGATTTPAVVTAGKTLRITRFAATFVASATSVYGVFKLRVNTGGVVVIGSPIVATIIIGAGTPATANSSNTAQADIPDGLEIPAGSGIGISAQTFNGTTATNGGFVAASVLGFEY